MTQQLSLFSETELEHRAPDGFPVSCPTLDLLATWDSAGKDLYIVRPPNQAVSKVHQIGRPGEKAPEALCATWKVDGQFLAVGWSDGYVRLVGQETSKAAHHIEVCAASKATISHIGWACNRLNSWSTTSRSSGLSKNIADEWRSLNGGEDPEELPRQLTFLELETALPKVSPLPTSSAGAGEDATVFTQRTSIEFLFQPLKPQDYDQVNVMIVGTSDSTLQLSIYDSFILGSYPCPSWSPSTPAHLVGHSSNPKISTHTLIVADKPKIEAEQLHLIPMDMPFLFSSPVNLSLLASKLTTLQKLLRYLRQTQLHMLLEWKNTRELPDRFLRSVQGGLDEATTGPRSIVPALYHTVVTGHAHEPVREWLVESLAERGHKRWDKAVVSGLENLRSLVHENFLPVLERCSVILSRLRGLARFYDSREDIGFSVTKITKVMDIVTCLSLVGHKILVAVMNELDHFNSFSTWLRFQIDRLAGSSESEELTEKEATMDVGKVLTYIEKYLVEGSLSVYFNDVSEDEYASERAKVDDGVGLLDLLTAQLKKHDRGQQAMKAFPQVKFLVDYASFSADRIFNDIAGAKKRSVRFGKPIEISKEPVSCFDSRMRPLSSKCAIIDVAYVVKDRANYVHLIRVELEIINGISSNRSVEHSAFVLGHAGDLLDINFLGDHSLLLLCIRPEDNTHVLVKIPIGSDANLFDSSEGGNGSPKVTDDFPHYSLPHDTSVRPVRMEVHDRSDLKGEIPERVVLLGSNKSTLYTFTFPE